MRVVRTERRWDRSRQPTCPERSRLTDLHDPAITIMRRRMPYQAQEHGGAHTASRPQRTTAAIEAAQLVGAASHVVMLRDATTCQVVWTWTEMPISARRGVIVHRQRLLDWLPLRVTHICVMVYSCASLYRGGEPARAAVIAARALSPTEHRVTDDLEPRDGSRATMTRQMCSRSTRGISSRSQGGAACRRTN
jgi:hypothetical protein